MTAKLVENTEHGLYCSIGNFHIDPWRAVDRAVITHAHADHARWGSQSYLAAAPGEMVLRQRLGKDAKIETLPYGQPIEHNGVQISFHPAGHVLGSAQIRLEYQGEIWVISGDYKLEVDATCTPFEPVRCHTFITESTFGLPIYCWENPTNVMDQINHWWRTNQSEGKVSILYGYALGKTQRILSGLDPALGPIYCHGAVQRMNQVYRDSGIPLPATLYTSDAPKGTDWSQGLILAPPSSHNTPWMKKFGPASTAMASGWMRVRGARRRRAMDRGFILSDHADWPGLQSAIRATGAELILVTHGYTTILARWLQEQGLQAEVLTTQFEGEIDDAEEQRPIEIK